MRMPAHYIAISALALAAIAGFEGYRSRAYDDGTGVHTVGYGSTVGVTQTTTITPGRALIRLATDADSIGRSIARCIGEVPLHQHEFDAYASLAYNIGPGAFCRSTIVRRLKETLTPALSQGERERLYAQACDEILRWDKAGGRVLPGLVKRRQAEHRLCRDGAPMTADWAGQAQGGGR